MKDLISRQAALDAIDKNRQDLLSLGMTGAEHTLVHYGRRVIEELPSAQPEKRTEERTETHACDLIDREAAIDALENTKEVAR